MSNAGFHAAVGCRILLQCDPLFPRSHDCPVVLPLVEIFFRSERLLYTLASNSNMPHYNILFLSGKNRPRLRICSLICISQEYYACILPLGIQDCLISLVAAYLLLAISARHYAIAKNPFQFSQALGTSRDASEYHHHLWLGIFLRCRASKFLTNDLSPPFWR